MSDLPDGWRRSAKGNAWRFTGDVERQGRLDGDEKKQIVTVYEIGDGRDAGKFKYVCEGEFSDQAYDDEADAIEAAEEEWC